MAGMSRSSGIWPCAVFVASAATLSHYVWQAHRSSHLPIAATSANAELKAEPSPSPIAATSANAKLKAEPSYRALMAAAAATAVDSASSRAEMPWEEWVVRGEAVQLDDFGHAFHIHNFLSSAEVEHLRSLAVPERLGPAAMGDGVAVYPHVHVQFRLKGDAVAVNVSARIGELTGIPPHSKEDFAAMTVMRPWCSPHDICPTARVEEERQEKSTFRAGVEVTNLHHDHNQNARRVATVIVYLSEGGNSRDDRTLQGGETLFPCVLPRVVRKSKKGKGTKPLAAVSLMCETLAGHFRAGRIRHLTPYDGLFSMMQPNIPMMTQGDAATANALCSASQPPTGSLRVTPVAGSALLFLSASAAENRLLEHMWHGGCRVRRGQKVIMQQFKSLPPAGDNEVSVSPGWATFNPEDLMDPGEHAARSFL